MLRTVLTLLIDSNSNLNKMGIDKYCYIIYTENIANYSSILMYANLIIA